MTSPGTPRREGGSTVRIIVGAGLVVAAMATAVVGFVRLVSVLEAGGYGTPPMRTALVILGVSGAGFAGGIATLVWDIAKRFESPSQPEVGDGNSPR